MTLNGASRALLVLSTLGLLSACPQETEILPEPPTPPLDPSTLPCSPPLVLTAERPIANPLSVLRIEATGGTEHYQFEALDTPSGGILNPLTGGYLTGPEADVIDRIQLTDSGCIGEAFAEILVVPPMAITPPTIDLPTGESFQYEVELGSGSYECSMAFVDYEGSVTPGCAFTAPPYEAYDGVRVTDLETGEEVIATVRTVDGAQLSTESNWLFVPTGSEYLLELAGGSAYYEVTRTAGDSIEWDGASFHPTEVGSSTFLIEDRFVDLEVEIEVTAVAPQSPPLERWGDLSRGGELLSAGDLDGDGFGDFLVGLPEIDLVSRNGGAVFLHSGAEDGLDLTPTASWGGWDEGESFGDSLAVADFDDDGLPDLAVGAPLADLGGADSGGVHVYMGVEGGGFEEEASVQLAGPSAGAWFGEAVAACDFNGDGIDDLAVGAPRGEDPLALQVANNQGAVYIHLGTPDGLETSWDNAAFGEFPAEGGGFTGRANAYIGRTLAAGEINGDGLCDLAVGAWEFQGGDGAVHLYYGKAEDAFDGGGLAWDPVKIWTGDPAGPSNTHFGRGLAMGDVDGDGTNDVVVGQPGYRDPEGTGNTQGAVWLFLGHDYIFDDEDEEIGELVSDWDYVGNEPGDALGSAVSVADLDGDGAADILVGAPLDEATEGPFDTGAAAYFSGTIQGLPAVEPDAWILSTEEEDPSDPTVLEPGDYFAQLVAIHPGNPGGPEGELIVHSGRDNSLGWNVGRTLAVPGDFESAWRAFDLPGGPSGQALG